MSQLAPQRQERVECWHCDDSGLWIQPNGYVVACPGSFVKRVHGAPNPASTILGRAVREAQKRAIVNSHLFYIARDLTRFTNEQPSPAKALMEKHFRHLRNPISRMRHLHDAIAVLRSDWLMPIGSRKNNPSGYWIIVDSIDFAEWLDRSKAAPVTQLIMLHRVARANFPQFARQLELEFGDDVQFSEVDFDAAA